MVKASHDDGIEVILDVAYKWARPDDAHAVGYGPLVGEAHRRTVDRPRWLSFRASRPTGRNGTTAFVLQYSVSGRAMQLIRVSDHVRQFLDVSLKPIRSIRYRCKIHPRPPPKVKLANYPILK
jgi:hypothetical protein